MRGDNDDDDNDDDDDDYDGWLLWWQWWWFSILTESTEVCVQPNIQVDDPETEIRYQN